MERNSRIYVAGHLGLVGSAILRRLQSEGCKDIITRTRDQLDLTDRGSVYEFFQDEKPDYVYLAAAVVGGIGANDKYPADFSRGNLMIQTNVIDAAHQADVQHLLFLGSSCIYPRDAPQPMREEEFLSGPLEATNEPYAVAKIAGIKLCESYNRQHGRDYRSVMPTNLYGPLDNFDPNTSHVIPGLMRRLHDAKSDGLRQVTVWGSGTPSREFLYVDDLAAACVHLMQLDRRSIDRYTEPQRSHINVGTGEDITISELANILRDVVGFRGTLGFDHTKPDGAPRKLLEVSRLRSLGWEASVPLREGLEKTYSWYLNHSERIRY